MKYTFKKAPDSIVEIEAILEHQEFLNYYQPIYDQALSAISLKGFRPGAAPKELAEKAVNKEKVFEEAALKAIRGSLEKISEENSWQIIDQPKVEVLDDKNPTGLKFKVLLTIFPEIKLENYQKIAKKILEENIKEISVNEEEIEKTVQWVLNSRAKLIRVNKEAKMGDVVNIDFSGTTDGKTLEELSGKNDQFILGQGKFISGFEENIVGRKEKENLEFSINVPQDYWNQALRGKKIDFKVDLKGIFEQELPVLNDEFVKNLGKFNNVEDFKKSIKNGLEREKREKEKERIRLKIIDEIIKNSRMDLPKIMTERTLDNMIADYKTIAKNDKRDDLELRKLLEEKAKNNVAANLVIYEIAKEQHLEPSPEEIEKEASKFGGKIDLQKIYDYSYGIVRNKKVFEYLESLK